MNDLTLKKNLQIVSLVLRLAMGSLFLAAALIKVEGGISGTIAYYTSLFEKSLLPLSLVRLHASVVMIGEFTMAFWLITGFKVRIAWITSTFFLMSFAFGMMMISKFDVASDNYIYVLISCVGLLLSQYDYFNVSKIKEVINE